jgi:hypothetical protein
MRMRAREPDGEEGNRCYDGWPRGAESDQGGAKPEEAAHRNEPFLLYKHEKSSMMLLIPLSLRTYNRYDMCRGHKYGQVKKYYSTLIR